MLYIFTHTTQLCKSDWPVSVVFTTSHREENKHETTRQLLCTSTTTSDKEDHRSSYQKKQLQHIDLTDLFSFQCDSPLLDDRRNQNY